MNVLSKAKKNFFGEANQLQFPLVSMWSAKEWNRGAKAEKQRLSKRTRNQMCNCPSKKRHANTCDWFLLTLPHVILWEIASFTESFHDDVTLQQRWFKLHLKTVLLH
jgi:hypothetical protein